MSAYVIYHYNIINRNRINELTELSLPVNKKYGAKVIVGSPVKVLKGTTKSHMVVLEFSSFTAAQEYYYSTEHEELQVVMNEITDGWATIVPDSFETQELVDSGYFKSKP